MSLQVWLPLNGDLRNQGLNNMTFSNTNTTNIVEDSNGKLGKCYKRTTKQTAGRIISNTTINLSADFSMCCWAKVTDCISSANGLVSNHSHADNTGFGITVREISTTDYRISCNTGSGSDRTYNTYYGTSNIKDAWHHLAITYDKDNTQLKLWVDGICENTIIYNGVSKADYIILFDWSTTYDSYQYRPAVAMNDVRIYDHALSPLEVKRLAQGLVLHYPLSDAYIESTTNLITTEDCLSPTCYNAATSKYGYGTNTDIYKTVTTYDGRKGTKVYMGTNGNSCYPYVYVNNMFTSDGSNAPAYKTLSFDYYGTVGNYLGPYKLGSGEGTATYTVTCQGIKTTGTYSNFGGFTVTPNKWNHVEITFHGTTAANSEWGYIRIGNGNHTSNTSNFWFFANMQLEAKDHATGYVGVGNTRTVTTVYDTSGFGNNGTINGSLTVSSDTPKYNISTYVNSSSSINHSRCLSNDNQEWTCCAWVKLDGSTSYQQLNNFNNGNMVVYGTTPILYLNGGSDDYYMYGSQVIPVDEWTHIAFVFKNSTGLRNIYINGILKNNYGPNKTSTPSGIPDVVKLFGQNFSGYVSDYREYATALSADDVMALYKNAGYVDSDGNVYAYEMTE